MVTAKTTTKRRRKPLVLLGLDIRRKKRARCESISKFTQISDEVIGIKIKMASSHLERPFLVQMKFFEINWEKVFYLVQARFAARFYNILSSEPHQADPIRTFSSRRGISCSKENTRLPSPAP